ncbi:GTP-binding protein [Clostridium sp. 'White wine YQ']|uniref:GTP-binding protein n=1 Tax=Clostridium sp. 'White wine YQ' TaxID=3027474 RepID=UPI0023657C72|nr:GTP-binding protein [Clostridium sp. 'White wine YQ']MDD7796105.1 GTP-binding protein [Clostridium sp. 'White wine YQ']
MKKICSVEIVGGFLSWGKTSFINSYLEVTRSSEEVLVIIQCEKGNSNINEEFLNEDKVILKQFKNNDEITERALNRIINFNNPNRIIIEANGVQSVDYIIREIHKSRGRLGAVFAILDGKTVDIFIRSMGVIMLPLIHMANMIIINNCEYISYEKNRELKVLLGQLNKEAYIEQSSSSKDFYRILSSSRVINKGLYKKIIDFINRG